MHGRVGQAIEGLGNFIGGCLIFGGILLLMRALIPA